jgi:hypothetical protein
MSESGKRGLESKERVEEMRFIFIWLAPSLISDSHRRIIFTPLASSCISGLEFILILSPP